MITKKQLMEILEGVPDDAVVDATWNVPTPSRVSYSTSHDGLPIKSTVIHKDSYELNIAISFEQ